MVACKFFLNGNCRFGSKCINDHLDIRQLIKSEVGAALKGSQWPLSCFGPFKEKPSIPNFIEDQSMEEIRWSCYQAKQQNTFPAFEHQFKQRVLEAQEKMKALLNLNRPIIDVIVAIYDKNDTGNTSTTNNMNNNNNTLQSGSLFGSAPNQQNPFSNRNSTNIVTGSIFGQNPSQTGSGGGLFTFATAQTNGFGSSNNNNNNNQQIGSIFGGNRQQPQQQGQTNMFGGFVSNMPSVDQSGNSLFSSINQQQQSQQTHSSGSIFGTNNNGSNQAGNVGSTSLFGSVPQSQNAFSINSTNNQQGNLFMQSQQTAQNTGNIFVQQNQQNSTFSTGLFGQQQPQTQVVSSFGQNQNATTANSNLFGQQNQPQQQNMFSMQQQQPQQQHQQNIFNSSQTQHQQQQENQHPQFLQGQQQITTQSGFAQTGLFSSVQNTSPQQNSIVNTPVNGNMMNAAPQGYPQTNLFQQELAPTSQIGNSHILSSPGVYSKIEDLTAEELEAFKADSFVLGKIPTKPPPRELI